MNVIIEISDAFAGFLENLLVLTVGLSAFFVGAALAKKHFKEFIVGDFEDDRKNTNSSI